MTVLWYTRIDGQLSVPRFNTHLNSLPNEIQNKIRGFTRWQDSHACLFGKMLLEQTLQYFDLHLALEDLKYSSCRRPYFSIPCFDFNISHSGDCVTCIASDEMRVGIDIERVEYLEWNDFRNQFAADEWLAIESASNPLSIFYEYWTKKEALIKADGAGLLIDLCKLNVFGNPKKVLVNSNYWNLEEIHLYENYKCAVASSMPLRNIEYKAVSFVK